MRFLVIDDNPYDRELVIRGLTQLFPAAVFVEVIDNSTFEQALQVLDYEVVFTDYQLKWTNGLEILTTIRHLAPELPIIMVTDTGSEEIATEAMKNGLNDYLIKSHLTRLPIAVQECLAKVQLQAEHRQLEAQLQKSQKMESLGLLVSGIAHDFNNILAAIKGYAERGISQLTPQHPLYEHFDHIQNRAEQGARLTRQLLAFARGMPLDPKAISLNEMILSLTDFLQKLLGPSIELHTQCFPELYTIYADRTQLEQILVNLCINARDAMPSGGTLSIETGNVQIEQDAAAHLLSDPVAGSYVLLTITDTGSGMDEQIQARLFEPFFTTKDVGMGTGLGLSVVYGIMKQHQGFIQIKSAPDQGTTFSLYFPAVSSEQEVLEEFVPSRPQTQRGAEMLLVVEDDQDIQFLIAELLRSCGYTVVLASNGEEGVAIFEQHASSIALIIADIMMPKMKGREFQEYIRRRAPGIKILVISGYQEMDLKRRELLDPGNAFLQKPFNLEELEAKVRELLES